MSSTPKIYQKSYPKVYQKYQNVQNITKTYRIGTKSVPNRHQMYQILPKCTTFGIIFLMSSAPKFDQNGLKLPKSNQNSLNRSKCQ